jgi:hypothetical protein
MAMLHLRIVCPQELESQALGVLHGRIGVVAVTNSHDSTQGTVISADVARESADQVLADLRRIGVGERGLVALDPIDAAFGALVDQAERDAPGEGADALIWDELTERIGEDSTLTWTFVAFTPRSRSWLDSPSPSSSSRCSPCSAVRADSSTQATSPGHARRISSTTRVGSR